MNAFAHSARAFLQLLTATLALSSCTSPAPTSPVAAVPTPTFFTLPITAKRIVFILEHNDSMLDNFDAIRQETIRSINSMSADQSIAVIMVAESATPFFPDFKPATGETKSALAGKMAAFRAHGHGDDLLDPFQDAFKKAFAMHPDAIYFLTSVHLNKDLPAAIQKLNVAQSVSIHTLAFVAKEPDYEDQLQNLARANAGQYHFISENDLCPNQFPTP